jgi:hypothetical protein
VPRMPCRNIHDNYGDMCLHGMRVWNVQLGHGKGHSVRQQLRCWTVLECWSDWMHGVSCWNVFHCCRHVHLHKLRRREVPDDNGSNDVHELCVRLVQHDSWAHDGLHDALRCWNLLQRWCHCMHRLCRGQVFQRSWHMHMYGLRLWLLPGSDRPDVVHNAVSDRHVLEHVGIGVHELRGREVRLGGRHLHVHELRVWSVPTARRPDVVHVAVPCWSVFWNKRDWLH